MAARAMPLAADVDLDEVAGHTPGFVRADIHALVREAAVRAAHRQRSDDPDTATVSAADLAAALEVIRPSALGDTGIDVGDLTLDDVGDMVEVKQALTEAVLRPLSYPDTFTRMGIEPPRGVLLYGPPGCGKTFLVRALAATGQANLLAVKGAEVLSKWVGESEQALRESAMTALRESMAAPTVTPTHVQHALTVVRPSLDPAQVAHLARFAARHQG